VISTVKVNRKAQAKKIFAHYIAGKITGNRKLQLTNEGQGQTSYLIVISRKTKGKKELGNPLFNWHI
jgi:hypothetical protein